MLSKYHENSTINGTQPPDPQFTTHPYTPSRGRRVSKADGGGAARSHVQNTPDTAYELAAYHPHSPPIGECHCALPHAPIPRPTRPHLPLGLVDLQSLPPRGWCKTCGGEIYRPNADHCTRCRIIDN